jgi:RNA polymerase sigma-70 factor (ECF subfamily)
LETRIGLTPNKLIVENDSTKAEWVRDALRQHEGPLIRYAAQITGDLDSARDVVQDAFLRLCAKEPDQLGNGVAPWLFTVCRNRALDLKRKESRMTSLEPTELDSHQSREPLPDAAAEQRDNTSQVMRLLASLPPNQQEVIRLKFEGGLSYQEISSVTNLTVTNVGFLIHTAIKAIRQKLASESKSGPNILRSAV